MTNIEALRQYLTAEEFANVPEICNRRYAWLYDDEVRAYATVGGDWETSIINKCIHWRHTDTPAGYWEQLQDKYAGVKPCPLPFWLTLREIDNV